MEFRKALKAELFKVSKKKHLRQLLIISIVLFVILLIAIEMTYVNNKSIRNGKYVNVSSSVTQIYKKYDTHDYNSTISAIESKKQDLKQEIDKESNIVKKTQNKKELQQTEKEAILIKYLKDHGINPQDAKIYQVGESNVAIAELITQIVASSNGFPTTIMNIRFIVQLVLGILGQIFLYYIIVMTVNTYTNELNTGEMRLVAIRPVKKKTILSAKIISVMLSTTIMVLGVYVLSLLYGLTFNKEIGNAYTVIGNNVVVISSSVSLLLPFLNFLANLIFVTFMTIFLATFIKQTNTVVVLSFVIMILGPVLSIILGLVGIEMLEWTVAMNFISTLSFNSTFLGSHMDFYSGLIIYVAYLIMFILVSYYRHSKKDIA